MSTEAPAGFVNAGREPPVRPGRPDPVVGLRWAVRVGVVLVLFTPLIVTTELVFPFVVGKALYARAVIEILFAFWIALVVRDGEQKPPVSRVLLAFGAWVLASWGAGLLGVSPTRSLWSTYERMQGVFDLAHWLAFAIVAASVFRSLRDWRVLLGVNVAVSGLVCGLGVAQHFALVDPGWLLGSSRPGSSLGNPNYLGAYAMVNALIGLGLMMESLGSSRPCARRLGGLWTVALVVNGWALWLSGTRSAVAGLVAAGFALAVVCLHRGDPAQGGNRRGRGPRHAGGGGRSVRGRRDDDGARPDRRIRRHARSPCIRQPGRPQHQEPDPRGRIRIARIP